VNHSKPIDNYNFLFPLSRFTCRNLRSTVPQRFVALLDCNIKAFWVRSPRANEVMTTRNHKYSSVLGKPTVSPVTRNINLDCQLPSQTGWSKASFSTTIASTSMNENLPQCFSQVRTGPCARTLHVQ